MSIYIHIQQVQLYIEIMKIFYVISTIWYIYTYIFTCILQNNAYVYYILDKHFYLLREKRKPETTCTYFNCYILIKILNIKFIQLFINHYIIQNIHFSMKFR